MDLQTAVSLLPTPTCGDAKSAANRTANRQQGSQHHDGVTLTDAVRMLPTPTSRDWKGQNQRGDTSCLPGAITSLQSDDGNTSPDQCPGQLTIEDASVPTSSNG